MKHLIRRGLGVALAVVMATGLLSSCGSDYDPVQDIMGYKGSTVLFTVNGQDVTAEQYLFWLAQQADTTYSYASMMQSDDSETSFWDSKVDENSDKTIAELTTEKIQTIGENIKIRRFVRYEGEVATYIHAGGNIGVMVKFDTDVADKEGFEEYGKDVAMQIAAANPSYLNREAVPAEAIENEKKIIIAQMANDPKAANKPDAIKEKMATGRLGKFYKENCLVDQAFIKDGNMDVNAYVNATAKKLGGDIKIVEYTHFIKGEGLEKRVDDFAAEVAAAVKG